MLWEDTLNWRPSYEGSGDAEWVAERIADIIQLGSRVDLDLLNIVEHPDRWGCGAQARGEQPAAG